MTQQELEEIYGILAENIDQVGQENSTLLLAKLVLLMAKEYGDVDTVAALIRDAAASLSSREN